MESSKDNPEPHGVLPLMHHWLNTFLKSHLFILFILGVCTRHNMPVEVTEHFFICVVLPSCAGGPWDRTQAVGTLSHLPDPEETHFYICTGYGCFLWSQQRTN